MARGGRTWDNRQEGGSRRDSVTPGLANDDKEYQEHRRYGYIAATRAGAAAGDCVPRCVPCCVCLGYVVQPPQQLVLHSGFWPPERNLCPV